MDTEAVFSHVIEGGQPVTLEFATENATAFRWDYLAATMLDEDHYDAYMADIDFALREFAHAQHEARLQFHAMRGREPVTGHHISKQMRFHRARLQHEKAKAFATALAAQRRSRYADAAHIRRPDVAAFRASYQSTL